MKFSVIVPIYNVSKYLPQCIESIISQNYDDYELILVNDGSTDDSLSICRNYANMDSHIVVVNKENGGLTSARKAGLEVAKGDYIACVDGDDYVDTRYFGVLSKLVESDSDCICFGYYTFSNEKIVLKVYNAQPEGIYREEKLLEIKNNIIYSTKLKGLNYGIVNPSIWSKVVKRDIYKKAQMKIDDRVSFGEDLLLTTLIFKSIKSLTVSSDNLYWYRIINNSMSREYNPKVLNQLELVAKCLKDWLGEDKRVSVYLYMQLFSQISKAANALNFVKFKAVMNNIRKNHLVIYNNAVCYLNESGSIKDKVKKVLLTNRLDSGLFFLIKHGGRR